MSYCERGLGGWVGGWVGGRRLTTGVSLHEVLERVVAVFVWEWVGGWVGG